MSTNTKGLRVGSFDAVFGAIPRIVMTASDTTPTLEPNKMYVFPEMASLAVTLAAISDNSVINEYDFFFDSGDTATNFLVYDHEGNEVLQPDGFAVEANHRYQVSVVENCMLAVGWAVSAE